MSKSPLKFGAIGAIGSMFGTMGNNQMINSLTNANALAAQQAAARQVNRNAMGAAQPVGSGASGVGGNNDLSQMVMDGSMSTFDPAAQQAGMGIFGSRDARNRALYPSAIMMHDDVQKQIDAKKEEIKKAKAEGGDPDIVFELQSDLMDLEKELKTAKEAHNSPAKHVGQVNAPAGQGHNKNHEDKGEHYHQENPRRKGKYMTIPAKENK